MEHIINIIQHSFTRKIVLLGELVRRFFVCYKDLLINKKKLQYKRQLKNCLIQFGTCIILES